MVHPDYLVSRDSNRPHCEIMAAAHPVQRDRLLAGAITFTRPDGGVASKVYTSDDRGITWSDVTFPEQQESGGADPQVAYSRAGTAIFAALNNGEDDIGRRRSFVHAYRYDEATGKWSKPINLGGSYDHPMLVADHTNGRHAGNLYMSVLWSRDYRLGVFRSHDDGRTWIGPVEFLQGEGKRGLNVEEMMVLTDGTLVATFIEFPSTLAMAEQWQKDDHPSRFFTVTSTDGGITFSPPRAGPAMYGGTYPQFEYPYGIHPVFAADPSDRARDRIYAVWPKATDGDLQLVIASSSDRGATWSEPRPVDVGKPDQALQFQATVTVNSSGVVGVGWYDTRDTDGPMEFNQYFAASLDGGATFLPPARVSTATSRPLSSGNLLPSPTSFVGSGGEMRVGFLSGASRWLNGGDYMGIAADAGGAFHLVWADARGDAFQAYTARIEILKDDRAAVAGSEAGMRTVDLNQDIELVADPGTFDVTTLELSWWIRLKNTSSTPIAGPIEVEIRNFGSGRGDLRRESAPVILNAVNGNEGGGAKFVYDLTLGSEGVLSPGEVSGAQLWKFRLKSARRTPDLHLFVTGRRP